MVQYRTTYRANPSGKEAGQLTNYACRGGDVSRVERAGGFSATAADVDAFEKLIPGNDLARMHSFSFAENRQVDELANKVRGAIDDNIEGQYLIGVDTEGNNHVHVAEVGDWDDVYMTREDIDAIRSDVADAVGESVAANQVKA